MGRSVPWDVLRVGHSSAGPLVMGRFGIVGVRWEAVSVRALEKVHLKICLVRLSRENMRGSNQLLKVQHLHDQGEQQRNS
jgi:hypothetical protein